MLAVIGKQGGPATDSFVHHFRTASASPGRATTAGTSTRSPDPPSTSPCCTSASPSRSYRSRPILYPFLAGRLAPHGGTALLLAFVLVSLAGRRHRRLGHHTVPRCAALAAPDRGGRPGCGGGALLHARRRPLHRAGAGRLRRHVPASLAVATLLLVLACLTVRDVPRGRALPRDVAGAPRRCPGDPGGRAVRRLRRMGAPRGPPHGHVGVRRPRRGLFTSPFAGWAQGIHGELDLLIPLVLGVVLIAALVTRRPAPLAVRLYIGATTAMLICSTTAITAQWIDSSHVVAVALPLAVWVLAHGLTRRRGGADDGQRRRPRAGTDPGRDEPARLTCPRRAQLGSGRDREGLTRSRPGRPAPSRRRPPPRHAAARGRLPRARGGSRDRPGRPRPRR